jgi:dTDP-4-amino-4,6-dideoxygalactose transaminase
VPVWAEPVWHLFVVRTPQRDALQRHLAEHGIGSQIHYPIPPHLSHAYAGAGWQAGAYPLAEQYAREVLSLPIGPHLSHAQVDHVCSQIRDFFLRG